MVHKRKYNQRCLPKGKFRERESWAEAALREVLEESGGQATILDRRSTNSYLVDGHPKDRGLLFYESRKQTQIL